MLSDCLRKRVATGYWNAIAQVNKAQSYLAEDLLYVIAPLRGIAKLFQGRAALESASRQTRGKSDVTRMPPVVKFRPLNFLYAIQA